ncbi:putative two-component sensor [Vibrio orientalis CIP 102891 = ATCC 33934]|uniref:histidine kinase n=2 Tax=Vibrio orientalis TaxID=28175 RepID=C9QJS8_VIBOR|nr:two-component system sensor protein [Vibrio orientalis CIP 102891 = ATCC 33934]EGU53750.1 putative two-component sensor [Vibrio orientalis CIP 102891 = ATCC 33934]
MLNASFSNTKTLTGHLAIFFTVVSITVGIVSFVIFYLALQWSEDRVGERRILIDRDAAVARFLSGETGAVRLDELTVAYNDMTLVPEVYREFLQVKESYLGEVGEDFNPLSHMVFKGQYTDQGKTKPIVLLTLIDRVEFDVDELLYSGTIVVMLVATLMFVFGTILYRLSIRLIEPLNDITAQLNQDSIDVEQAFSIQPQSAQEFHLLTDRLNQYRSELNHTLKREQAFARYASHELRTPLTVVKGANKLLMRAESTDFQNRQIQRIEDATNEMITMVDALLSIVRYERNAGDAPLRAITKDEIESILESSAIQASCKHLDIELSYSDSPVTRATEPVINMILGNLLRNAIAATEQGTISVNISKQQLVIIDDGSGLKEVPNSEGHGLGLLIVDDLCQRYQWQFDIQNHHSRGCIATIKFDPV